MITLKYSSAAGMRGFQGIISLALLFHSITALQVVEDSINSANTTDFSLLASNATVLVNNESGTTLGNPEETGAYFEGDILISGGDNSSAELKDPILWTSVTIPYVIEGNYSAQQRQMILQAIYTVQLWVGFQFVLRDGQNDYITIRNDKGAGCSSYVGRIGGRQVVNLEAPLCFAEIGTTLHELLHVLGLFHEHNNPKRDNYITINYTNIEEDKKAFFKKYTNTSSKNFGQYSSSSIMHFSKYAASKNRQKTIEAKGDGVKIGQRNGLSVRDIKAVFDLYDYSDGWIYEFGTEYDSIILTVFNMTLVSFLSEETIQIIRKDSILWTLISH